MILHNNICASIIFVLSVTVFEKSPLPGTFSNPLRMPILTDMSLYETPLKDSLTNLKRGIILNQKMATKVYDLLYMQTTTAKVFGLLYMQTTAKVFCLLYMQRTAKKCSVFFTCRRQQQCSVFFIYADDSKSVRSSLHAGNSKSVRSSLHADTSKSVRSSLHTYNSNTCSVFFTCSENKSVRSSLHADDIKSDVSSSHMIVSMLSIIYLPTSCEFMLRTCLHPCLTSVLFARASVRSCGVIRTPPISARWKRAVLREYIISSHGQIYLSLCWGGSQPFREWERER